MFEPPCCPNPLCPMHRAPEPGFFKRKGYYLPKCRSVPVPRFQCKVCRLGFSRQTFRVDYGDHKPHVNAQLVKLLASGLGLRQSARMLPLARKSTEHKFRKLARHLSFLNQNLRRKFLWDCEFEFDEMITFENCKVTQPLALPVAVETGSLLVIAAEPAPIRPFGRMSRRRRAKIAAHERKHGKRRDGSRRAILRVLGVIGALTRHMLQVPLRTDQKGLYRTLARKVFGAERLHLTQFSGKLPRVPGSPLFRINHTAALARDLNGRLRRRSWLASKKRHFLERQLGIFMCYRNFVRRRTNRDPRSPAMVLRWLEERLTVQKLIGWRQDWGRRSGHPLSDQARSIREVNEARDAELGIQTTAAG